MNFSIEQLILILIFLVILIVLLIFTVFGKDIASQVGLQSKLYNCCEAYKANGCTNPNIVCDTKSGETLSDIQLKLGFDSNQLLCTCKCTTCIP